MDAVYDTQNRQIPEQTPIELPLGYTAPESMEAMIARILRVNEELKNRTDIESIDEASDFDIEGDTLDTQHTWTELQEEELKASFANKSNRIPASDEEDQDDEGVPLSNQMENIEDEQPPAPKAKSVPKKKPVEKPQ